MRSFRRSSRHRLRVGRLTPWLEVPTQQLGVPGPLPTTFGGGSAGGYSGGVVAGVFGPDRGRGSDDDMGGGGDEYYGSGSNGDDFLGGVSYKERERKRKAGKRANPALRAEKTYVSAGGGPKGRL